MIYITGDTHGDFRRIAFFCDVQQHTSPEDIMIILGDAGINYYENYRDTNLKVQLADLPITLFCIHGNHEAKPECTDCYEEKIWHGGKVFIECKIPNILFAKDGEIFDFDGIKSIAIGGAYSIDKEYRLTYGLKWWSNEQPNKKTKQYVEKQLAANENKIDVILSHTCPLKYEPIEVFTSGIDQSLVDKSTEAWLDYIEEKIEYKKWYCGHYHTQKAIDKINFMFTNIEKFQLNNECS